MSTPATRGKVQAVRTPNPLLKRTERRRSRSRSRQRIESEFVKKFENLNFVKDSMEYLTNTYSAVKDSNPLFKQSFQMSEDAAFWMKQKATDVVVATKLDGPLKQLDSVAAQGLTRMVEAKRQMRIQLEEANEQMNNRISDLTSELRTRTDYVQSQILESIQTLLDYFEDRFEPVMLPASPEAAKYAEDVSLKVTLNRIMDLTYRLNAGAASMVGSRVKAATDPVAWRVFLEKSLSPSHIKTRFFIIRHEVFLEQNKKLSYMEDKELLDVDRFVIATSRTAIANVKFVNESLRTAPRMTANLIQDSFKYSMNVLQQLREANSLKDVSGIVLHETRDGIESIQAFFPSLANSQIVNNLKDWLVTKEKTL